MPYTSTINFTLDTICPWTYLSYTRLSKALQSPHLPHPSDVTFNFHFHPYQLHAETPSTGTNKAEWYKSTMFEDSPDRWKTYTQAMQSLGAPLGINFLFGGLTAGTLHAHRTLQYFQQRHGETTARRLLEALYQLYFEEEAHPSSPGTLREACARAGIDSAEAKAVIEDESVGLAEVKGLIREQELNGVDAVPFVSIEGKRRDFGVQGAKSVEEYVAVLKKVIAESSE